MSAKRVPYFNFYPTDFMRGVRGLTPQEVGIYTMLLCLIYEHNGPVARNIARLSAYCGCRPSSLEKALDRLAELGRITVADGMVMDDRAAEEIAKREHALKLQSLAGEKSAEKRKQNQGEKATGVQRAFNHTDTDKEVKEREAKASPKKRATRLPDDWFLPVTWGQWAMAEGYAESTIRTEADNFRDYWRARAGPTASKLDWEATWRIWMRKAPKANGRKPGRQEFDRAIGQVAAGLTAGTIHLDTDSRDPFAVGRRGNAAAR